MAYLTIRKPKESDIPTLMVFNKQEIRYIREDSGDADIKLLSGEIYAFFHSNDTELLREVIELVQRTIIHEFYNDSFVDLMPFSEK